DAGGIYSSAMDVAVAVDSGAVLRDFDGMGRCADLHPEVVAIFLLQRPLRHAIDSGIRSLWRVAALPVSAALLVDGDEAHGRDRCSTVCGVELLRSVARNSDLLAGSAGKLCRPDRDRNQIGRRAVATSPRRYPAHVPGRTWRSAARDRVSIEANDQ